ncbi:hypothetical protein POM88_015951 [Heracleum sosnowskyi]|uniref:Uncharacterized protein n=1 Tax=Heracleum sosnowskyi TaxID=360622 RepID=A0AAD8IMC8_9APIA|nr:hypothetical protein POM88_015951 [Heracleum sosnowskyi]
MEFTHQRYGTLCIRENPGCLFIATNRDDVGNMTELQEWPGVGCMVSAICGSTEKEPILVRKPTTFMMDFLLEKKASGQQFKHSALQSKTLPSSTGRASSKSSGFPRGGPVDSYQPL